LTTTEITLQDKLIIITIKLICFKNDLFYNNPTSSLIYTRMWVNCDYGDNRRSAEMENEHTPQIPVF